MNSKKALDYETAISLADTMYEMGKEMLSKKQYGIAVKWLDRSYDVLASQELEKLGREESELRLSIIQTLVKALISTQSQEAFEKAQNLASLLESEVGHKLVVLLLKLEILSASTNEVFEDNAYRDVLMRIIQTVVLTDHNFKLIMHHIRKLHTKSPSLACNVIDEFLQTRLFEAEREDWVEKVLVTRIWMATAQREGQDVVTSVEKALTTVASNVEKPLSTLAAHAAQIVSRSQEIQGRKLIDLQLIWKQIESSYAQSQYDLSERWCRLAMHQLFSHSGEMNLAKAARYVTSR